MTQTIHSFGVITEALIAAGLSGQLLKKENGTSSFSYLPSFPSKPNEHFSI